MSWLSLGAAAHMACKKSINFVGDRWRMVRLVSMKPDNLDDGSNRRTTCATTHMGITGAFRNLRHDEPNMEYIGS